MRLPGRCLRQGVDAYPEGLGRKAIASLGLPERCDAELVATMRWRLGDLPFYFRIWPPGRVVIDIHEEHASSGACFSLMGFFFCAYPSSSIARKMFCALYYMRTGHPLTSRGGIIFLWRSNAHGMDQLLSSDNLRPMLAQFPPIRRGRSMLNKAHASNLPNVVELLVPVRIRVARGDTLSQIRSELYRMR